MPSKTEESSLQKLADLAALGQTWAGLTPVEISRSLIQALQPIVGATGAEVRLFGPPERAMQLTRGRWQPLKPFMDRFEAAPVSFRMIESGDGVRVLVTPLGANGEIGALGLCSPEPDFAGMADRMAVDAAAAQASMAIQVSWLNEALAQSRGAEEHLKIVLEDAPTAVHWVNEDGLILYANKADHALLGYPPGQLIGRSIREFHADKAILDGLFQRLHRGETINDLRAPLIRRDGSIVWALIDTNAYFVNGKFRHSRCFVRADTKERAGAEPVGR